jgi:hypothetical protein
MISSLTRRRLLTGAADAGMALTLTSLLPRKAAAGSIAEILNYFLSDQPLLGTAALIEARLPDNDSRINAKLNEIADKIYDISSSQDAILKELADQRIVMREELRRGNFADDARNLQAIAYNFKVSLGFEGERRKQLLRRAVSEINKSSEKLGDDGLAAVPTYIGAIALQNGVHYLINSTAEVFRLINAPHRENLARMLHGSGEDSLAYYRQQAVLDERGQDVLHTFGRIYPISEIVRMERMNGGVVTVVDVFSLWYLGFGDNGPNLKPVVREGLRAAVIRVVPRYQFLFNPLVIYPYANKIYADDYTRIPELNGDVDKWYGASNDTFTYNGNGNGLENYSFNGRVKDVLQSQMEAIIRYYQKFLDQKRRADTTADELSRMIQNALNGIDRVLAARARMEVNPATAFPAPTDRPRL